jgi:hypothetical protein
LLSLKLAKEQLAMAEKEAEGEVEIAAESQIAGMLFSHLFSFFLAVN